MGSVGKLKDTLCQQHVLSLIFTKGGDSLLTAYMYINMKGNVGDIE